MIINFLQTRTPKILPILQQPPHLSADNKYKGAFYDDLKSLEGFGQYNEETLGELLWGFFRRYGHEINYEREVISVRVGGLISKHDKKWHLLQNNRLGVEEPFNTERNLGNTADDTSFRGVHLELRRAFDLVSQGKLDQCCEQYEFPAQEEKFWTRPTPQPRPVLSRSQSQTGRSLKSGSSSGKASSSGQKHRNGNSNRRASSAAAMNKMPMYPAMSNGDRSLSSNQIHDQLFHHYQMLQQQEQQLRLQMHQRAQATLHAQVTAQVQTPQLQIQTTPYSQHGTPEGHRRQSNIEPPPLSAPLRSIQAYYYPMSMLNQSPVQSLSPSLSTSQNTTSPSSPSQTSAQPVSQDLRRGTHRSAVSDSNGTLRSHSQPPANMKVYPQNGRPVPVGQYHTPVQGPLQGYTTLQQYQQAFLQGQGQSKRTEAPKAVPEPSEPAPQLGPYYEPSMQDPMMQEYAKYYVDANSLNRSRDRNALAPQLGAYSDPAYRARTVSPNLTRVRHQTSRSPSPSHSSNSASHSINFYSSESPPFQQYSRGMMGDGQTQSSGPVIVDGSSDTSEYTTTSDAIYYPPQPGSGRASTTSDDRPINTPTTDSGATPMQESSDPFSLDGYNDRTSVLHPPGVLQFGEFPARATFRPPPPSKVEESKSPEKNPIPSIRKDVIVGNDTNGLGIAVNSTKVQDHPLLNNVLNQKPMHHSSTLSGLNLASSLKPLATLSPVREVRTPSPTATRNLHNIGESSDKVPRERASSLTSSKDPGPSPLATSSISQSLASNTEPGPSKREAAKSGRPKAKESQPMVNGISPNSMENTLAKPVEKMPSKPVDKPASKTIEKMPSQQGQQQSQTKQNNAPQGSGWQQSTGRKKKNKKSASVGSVAIPLDPNERKGG